MDTRASERIESTICKMMIMNIDDDAYPMAEIYVHVSQILGEPGGCVACTIDQDIYFQE